MNITIIVDELTILLFFGIGYIVESCDTKCLFIGFIG